MAAPRPLCIARVKNVDVTKALLGSPKLILETPRTDDPPNLSWIILIVSKVALAALISEETAIVRLSMITSFLGIPHLSAFL